MSSEWELDEGIKSIKSAWRREHTARANLEKMLEQTEAENAKLREERRKYQATIDSLVDECTDHKAENAKLRELIADVHEALCADKAGIFHRLTLASMEDDMREMGIEVDV